MHNEELHNKRAGLNSINSIRNQVWMLAEGVHDVFPIFSMPLLAANFGVDNWKTVLCWKRVWAWAAPIKQFIFIKAAAFVLFSRSHRSHRSIRLFHGPEKLI